MTHCVFCEIAAKRLDPDLIVFEDEHALGVVALQQKSRNHGHLIVVPKRHTKDIYDLAPDLHAPLLSAVQRLARAAKRAFAAEGIHIRQNNERAAGQDVLHLHFHVIPRYADDGFEAAKYERLALDVRRELANRVRSLL